MTHAVLHKLKPFHISIKTKKGCFALCDLPPNALLSSA